MNVITVCVNLNDLTDASLLQISNECLAILASRNSLVISAPTKADLAVEHATVAKANSSPVKSLEQHAASLTAAGYTREARLANLQKAREAKAAKRGANPNTLGATQATPAVPVRPAPAAKFAVKLASGAVSRKRFETQADAQAWLSSWVNKHSASKYSVVSNIAAAEQGS